MLIITFILIFFKCKNSFKTDVSALTVMINSRSVIIFKVHINVLP